MTCDGRSAFPPSPGRFAARLLITGMLLALGAALPVHAETGDTLATVRARGVLRCGVSLGIDGFSAKGQNGQWRGLDVDFCRAMATAVLCGSLALLLENSTKFEPIDKVLGDIDWTTLIFLGTIFCLVEALIKTGIFGSAANLLYSGFGTNLPLVALVTMLGTFAASALIANIPLMLAMTLVTKSYFIVSGLMPETALSTAFGPWPPWTLPVFFAMTFGTTLGGGATMVGDSANIVACGICARAGRRVSFMRFLKVGLPISLAQLAAGLIYIGILSHSL